MSATQSVKIVLDQKFEKIKEAPVSFGFFVCIHDFVEFIESTPSFNVFFTGKKAAQNSEFPKKYFFLKQIYQGIEDINRKSTRDLGHDRYMTIRELTMIRNKDVSESNSFWKRRELLRKLTEEVYKTLHAHLS